MLKYVALAVMLTSSAMAQSNSTDMGTPEQRAACGPDVGRFCKHVKPEEGPMAYLSCLQANGEKLRPACKTVIGYGGAAQTPGIGSSTDRP